MNRVCRMKMKDRQERYRDRVRRTTATLRRRRRRCKKMGTVDAVEVGEREFRCEEESVFVSMITAMARKEKSVRMK